MKNPLNYFKRFNIFTVSLFDVYIAFAGVILCYFVVAAFYNLCYYSITVKIIVQ